MRFTNPAVPGRAVRLAYCLNLHPADTLEGLLAGLRSITLPLRERLAPGKEFGVGMYVPAGLVPRVVGEETGRDRPLSTLLEQQELDPFTWNAFPFGGFGAAGLKERVFEPTWYDASRSRSSFTKDIVSLACRLARDPAPQRHLSISTHTGWHGSARPTEVEVLLAAVQLGGAAMGTGECEARGRRAVISMEPEPRANCNDTAELAAWRRGSHWMQTPKKAGTCLDTCHAAVEFEDPLESMLNATADGAPLGKMQFTSALSLHATRRGDLDPLLALDEPRYLHQVTARTADGHLLRVGDLPELRAAIDQPGGELWWRDTELRCHFHVPVDLDAVGGLGTTREHADATLAAALAHPELWGTEELHVEIETYTWDVLPREARGPGELVDGLEREYQHVIERLSSAGWRPD